MATLNLTVNPLPTTILDTVICANETPFVWNGNNYSVTGTYVDTLASTTGGCDTVATLNLIVQPLLLSTVDTTICENQLPFTWNGNTFTSGGSFTDTLPSTTGSCDIIVTLNLTVNPLHATNLDTSICANQVPFTWYGNQYSTSGIYTDTIPSTTGGCDTVATLTLTVNVLPTITDNVTICANQLPYTWNGNTYNSQGTYTDTLINTTGGCDTVATLVLQVNPLIITQENVIVCANQLPYTWNGNTYGNAGTYTDTLPSTTGGCDTVATLILEVNPLILSTLSVTICANQLPFVWYGNLYTVSGTYTDTVTAIGTCDTVATLILTIEPLVTTTETITICSNNLPYLWNGNSYYAPGTYTDTLSSSGNGCDTLATLILNVLTSPVLVINNPPPVCEPNTVDITAPSITAGSSPGLVFTYWTDASATTPLANPQAIAVSGIYYIQASASNNCTTTQPVAVRVIVAKVEDGIRYTTLTAQPNTNLQLSARPLGITYNWTPPVGLNSTTIREPIFNYDREVEYLIHIGTDSGCLIVDTLLIRMMPSQSPIIRSDIFVPKAWSPNGDGHNDRLFPLTVNIAELKYFRIFNRWGQLVFETNIIGHGWDGVFKGVPQVQDVYTWTLEAIGEDGKYYKKAGNSVLLR